MTAAAFEPALAARGVVAAYGERRAVDGVDLSIARGGVTALCGPNGCGKSTLLRMLCGLQAPQEGEVLVEGRPLAALGRRERARTLTMLAQAHEAPPGLLVRELVAYGRYAHRPLIGALSPADRAAMDDAMAAMGLSALRERPLAELSGGERQRAWIAMALAQQCRILLLDEPTTWLDLRHQVELVDALRRLNRERGVTIVAVLHDLNQAAALADRVLLMEGGRVRHDGPPETALAAGPLKDVFGVRMWRMEHPLGGPVCLPFYGSRETAPRAAAVEASS
ncbi:ABC transporter ATP-binding protein [Methylocella sp.]|uniref:ABC transporter ATP-binding protein n=1 Tax=Methylocella sp. TaxID=1978226 RepID=UPI0035AE3970